MKERKRTFCLNIPEIQKRRLAKGWSQERLAVEVGVSKKSVERWENGGAIYARNISRLASVLGASPDDLYERHAESISSADRERNALLENVKRIWIDGVLRNSLQGTELINLNLQQKINSIRHPWDGVLSQSSHTSLQSFSSMDIAHVFHRSGEALLILGGAGAGKTTVLLQLANSLITGANNDTKHPIPCIFSLSSWALKSNSLEEWMIDELCKRYEVSLSLGREWLRDGKILPLLDGLNEISHEKRSACVESINRFRDEKKTTYGSVPIVVCCRTEEYKTLPVSLELNCALGIEPLSHQKVTKYLANRNSNLTDLLDADPRLWSIVNTPLLLTMLSRIYEKRLAHPPETKSTEKLHHWLLEEYVNVISVTNQQSGKYTEKETERWITWLAYFLQRNNQSILHLEWMQPAWLPERLQRNTGILLPLLASGLSVGCLFGVGAGIAFQDDTIIRVGVLFGFFGPIMFWALGYGDRIRPIETLRWSWNAMLANLGRRIFGALMFAVLFGGFGWIVDGMKFGTLSGIMSATVFFLFFELSGRTVEKRVNPNQGIHRSFVSGLIGLAVGSTAFATLLAMFIGPHSIFIGLGFGLVVALLNGWHTCLQHLGLRFILLKDNYAPWKYVRWLDSCAEKKLLRKVGGGYMFAHPLLLEHFANRNRAYGQGIDKLNETNR